MVVPVLAEARTVTIEPTPEQFAGWLECALAKYREDWGDNPAFRAAGPKIGIVAGEVARLAYQASADDELEACCEWLSGCGCPSYGRELRNARRPKPPSLKQQALEALDSVEGDFNTVGDRADLIRKALESIPEE